MTCKLPRHARLNAFLAAILAAGSGMAFAQAMPSAGELLRENAAPVLPPPSGRIGPFPPPSESRPAMATEPGVAVRIDEIRITGATVLAQAEWQALATPLIGREVGFEDLRRLADDITLLYRERGYALARAYLPAQPLSDGKVEIAILEGRLGDVRLENKSNFSEADILAFLAPESMSGTVVNKARLERRLLLLADLPGYKVNAELAPGSALGSTDMKVQVEGGPRVDGEAGADNFGNWAVGHYRGHVGLRILNASGWGDEIGLQGFISNDRMSYGRLSYALTVNREGTRVGAAASSMRYALGQEFIPLAADGEASTLSLSVSHPFVRSLSNNLSLSLSLEERRLTDRVGAIAASSDKMLHVGTLGVSGEHSGALGMSAVSADMVVGRLKLADPTLAQQDALGPRTAGSYAKYLLSLSHRLPWGANASLAARLHVQRAGKNLDSSEKFSLGGPNAVRAYPQGEAAGDDAWLFSLEARRTLGSILTNLFQGRLFFDLGRSRSNHDGSVVTTTSRTLSGVGLGFSLGRPGGAMLDVSLARRLSGGPATADKDSPVRLWISYREFF